MDITDSLEDIIPESNFDTDVSPETGEKQIISKTSHLEDIALADDEVQNSENESDEKTLHLKSDDTDKHVHVAIQNKMGDCIEENYLKACFTTDPVITSTNVSPVDKPLLQFLNVTTNNDNSVKSSDDGNNSDMLDEELQLRWDDDDNDGDNAIDSAEEDELLQEKTDMCEDIAEKAYTETRDLNIHPIDAIEENMDVLTPAKSDGVNKDLPTDSINIEEIVTQHGLRKPDMMLEIPTQELIDFMDEDETDLFSNLEMSSNNDNNIKVLEDMENKDLDKINLSKANNVEVQLNVEPKNMENVDKVSKESEDIIIACNNVSESIEKEVNKEIILSEIIMNSTESKSDENQVNVKVVDEPQPSTSKASIMEMRRDSDEVGEMSDSLGLLAESTRVVEDDEDQEEEEEDDDEGDDEDYDLDEDTSNQMVTEYSEDSNAVNSETDLVKFVSTETDIAEHSKDRQEADLSISNKQNETCAFIISDVKSQDDYNKNVTETTQEMECSDVTEVQGGTNDKDDGMDEIMILDKAVEQVNAESSQSAAKHLNIDDDGEVTTKLPDDIEQGVFIIEDENSVPVSEPQSPTAPETEPKNDDNVVLLESSSEEEIELNSEKGNTAIISPEKTSSMVRDVNTNILSPSKETSMDKNVEKIETDDIGSSEEGRKQTSKVPIGLEVFNVDSDEDEVEPKSDEVTSEIVEKLPPPIKCVNPSCQTPNDTKFYAAEPELLKFYEIDHKRKASVCETCANEFGNHIQELLTRFKNLTPLLELDSGKSKQELVEIYDSESEEEDETNGSGEKIGSSVAKFLEDNLADVFNESWEKYKMNSRLTDSQNELQHELNNLQTQAKEIDKILKECQAATDQLRNNVYSMFSVDRRELPAIIVVDTQNSMDCCYEDTQSISNQGQIEPSPTRTKRRLTTGTDTPAKRLAVPADTQEQEQEKKMEVNPPEPIDDDNVDVSVVKLSAEAAPPDLPPPGEVAKPPLKVGMAVYTMKSTFGFWIKAKIVEIISKATLSQFTICRVRLEYKFNKSPFKQVSARSLAYADPPDVRLIIGTRIIASEGATESFYSGVVAEVPNPVNKFRYLVFFDDGHAKYVHHVNTRLVCECSSLVWEEVHPFSKDFVRQYLLSYPERPMVRLRPKQHLKTEWQGKWWNSRVLQVDASLVEVMLAVGSPRREWIYRGSTRLSPLYLELQAAERHRARPVPRSGPIRPNMPYVEYTRYDEPSKSPNQTREQTEEIRRQRAVAKKSTATSLPQPPPQAPPIDVSLESAISRVVHYKPKNAVCPLRMVPHECGPHCRRSDVLPLKDLQKYNPLAKPLLSGWERQLVRYKAHKEVMYRAPCGRRLRNMRELHRYLRAVRSDMPVDLFDFSPETHCLAEYVLNNCLVAKKDLSHGKENMPVPCVNYYDESLPEFCSYNTERTPTAGVPLNLDPDFLCGCDCEDDCEDKSKCACWKMTLEGARTIGLEGDVGYVYRRLPDPLPTGIYECNSRCKCSNTCLNRVAQHPLQLKLQVFKTIHRGWGIRALNDVPKGTFLCVYAGNLLTDATANLDGLNEGDEYLAELDYIEVVEQMKEGFEEDIPEALKETDQKSGSNYTSEEDEESTDDEESKTSKDEQDDDFRPSYVDVPLEFNKHLRTRERRKKGKEDNANNDKGKEKEKEADEEVKNGIQKDAENENGDEDCITISDDEEVREPSRFTVQAGMDSKQLVSKYRSVRSYFGRDEACYIMDAKVQGNIGRYLNHSCCPNVFVQNVFVDTHDPRFPWVAFFALTHIRAGTELTWNYNYDVGSVPGKVLYCYCGAENCRGRLL